MNNNTITARVAGVAEIEGQFSIEIEQEGNDNLEWETHATLAQAEKRCDEINARQTSNWDNI